MKRLLILLLLVGCGDGLGGGDDTTIAVEQNQTVSINPDPTPVPTEGEGSECACTVDSPPAGGCSYALPCSGESDTLEFANELPTACRPPVRELPSGCEFS